MKLLISAYACAPNRGSEHGSAWNWTTEASRQGHELWVMVSPAHQNSIEAACRGTELESIHWVFPTIAFWKLQQAKEPKWERTYNFLWQREALRIARTLQRDFGFDMVHHLTWGGVRAPTFLGGLGVPLVIGPVGGGETSPVSLRDRLPPKGRVMEAMRDISNATITINPLVRRGLNDAAVIFARTADTKNLLTPAMRKKTIVKMELGVPISQITTPRTSRQSPPRLLFAGRLLYWKGVHIAVEALARLITIVPDVRFTIVGNGPEEARLRADIAARGLEPHVDFVSWMPQHEFARLYTTHDLFVFPSLHDSTGWVVLEALCQGMPVVCLDLGGPKDIVTPDCGVIVGTSGLTTTQVAINLADRIGDVLTSPTALDKLSAGAIARAHAFLLKDVVASLYKDAARMIEAAGGTAARAAHALAATAAERTEPVPVAETVGQSQ